jgi:hypothetical protein
MYYKFVCKLFTAILACTISTFKILHGWCKNALNLSLSMIFLPADSSRVVKRSTLDPGVVSSIPRRTSLSDETWNRDPMYQCYTLGILKNQRAPSKRVGRCPGSYVSAFLSLGRPISPKVGRNGRKSTKPNQTMIIFTKLRIWLFVVDSF